MLGGAIEGMALESAAPAELGAKSSNMAAKSTDNGQ